MSEARDTLILPCKHLCLCSACADSLRYQANNCPICRAPFRALLQIRAVRKMLLSSHPSAQISELQQVGQDVPAGYESIPLIEALNGPTSQNPTLTVPHDRETTGKKSKMHRNKSSSAGSLRHQNDNLQVPQEVTVPASGGTKESPGNRNLQHHHRSASGTVTDSGALTRAETAPPGRHRKHKQHGKTKNAASRPHTAQPSATSLAVS